MEGRSIKWLRWAFNCTQWKPTALEWIHANKCIQKEEIQRIAQFAFQAPAISSLVNILATHLVHMVLLMDLTDKL